VKALLDTHAFLWWIDDDHRLSPTARSWIENGQNEVLFSVVSAWEIVVKHALGRLGLDGTISELIPDQIERNAFQVLPLHLRHALRLSSLPDLHRDPFDRMLVAQAQEERIPILSGDRELSRYPAQVVW
jgi:PIN domain nuclease of toxin-antitoxin system